MDLSGMVAMKRKAVCRELRNKISSSSSSSIVDVWEDMRADRLRQVLAARDAATWNFDFQASTPLPGRYDWQRPSGKSVETPARIGRPAVQDWSVRRGRRPSSSARRRLVFDDQDLKAADGVVTSFLLRRLIRPPQSCMETTTELCSPQEEELRSTSTSSMLPAAVAFDNDQCHQTIADSTNFCVPPASSTGRRSLTKRTRSPYENPPLRISKITGKQPKQAVKILSKYYIFDGTKCYSLLSFFDDLNFTSIACGTA